MNVISEKPRQTPVIAEVEVLVAGGGPGGLAAAVAAARAGARTMLVERYGHLGGLATGGLVIWLPGFFPGGSDAYGGVPLEWVQRTEKLGGAHYRQVTETQASVFLDPELLKYTALEMVEEAGVDLLHHAWVVDTIMDGSRCRGVIIESKAGRQAILAQALVDGTGDGDLVAWAGGQFTSRDMPIALVFRLGGVDWEAYGRHIETHRQEFAGLRRDWEKEHGVRIPALDARDARGFAWCNSWGFKGYSALSASDLTQVEKRFRRAIMYTLDYMQRNLPGMERAFVVDTSPQIGTRDSRRIAGDHRICAADMDAGAALADSIGKGTKSSLRRPIFDIPYRCIVPRGVDNLVVSGRCASIADDAYEAMRLITPCLVMGQAAGVAAALAVRQGATIAGVEIGRLQETLRQQGVPLQIRPAVPYPTGSGSITAEQAD